MSNADRIEELRTKYAENPRRYFAPLANELRKAGDLTQAIAICREHLPRQPGHMSGYIVFGQTLFEADSLDEARTVFEQALALDPENLIALKHLGDIARTKGENAVARRWYERVLDADPRNDDIASQLASLSTPAAPAAAVAEPARGQPPETAGPAPSTFDRPATPATDERDTQWAPQAAESPRQAHHEPIDLDFPESPEPEAADVFEEGLMAPEWPDTTELVARIVAPVRPTPTASTPVSADAVAAFGREPHDPLPSESRDAADADGAPAAETTAPQVPEAETTGAQAPEAAETTALQVPEAAETTAPQAPEAADPDAVADPDAAPDDLLGVEAYHEVVQEAAAAEEATTADDGIAHDVATEGAAIDGAIDGTVSSEEERVPEEEHAAAALRPHDGEPRAAVEDEQVTMPDGDGDGDQAPVAERDSQAATPEPEPEPWAPDEKPDVPQVEQPAFATETMAELLVSQGFMAQAVDIYAVLVQRRPYDPVLAARLEELRAQQLMAAAPDPERASTEPAAEPEPELFAPADTSRAATEQPPAEAHGTMEPEGATLPPSRPAAEHGYAGSAHTPAPAFRTARDRFAELSRRRVPRRTPTSATAIADDAAEGLSTLFGAAVPDSGDDIAARALADAFAPVQQGGASLFEPAPPALLPEPSAPVSAVEAAGSESRTDRRPPVDYSFDRFFPDPALAADTARSAPPTSAGAAPSPEAQNEDLAQFSAWLKGLGNA